VPTDWLHDLRSVHIVRRGVSADCHDMGEGWCFTAGGY
jgi:hypothetical protein